MDTLELLVIALALSMDAFAISVGKGLSVERVTARHAVTVGAYFGGFQALMPVAGYLLGAQLGRLIVAYDHWISFALLALIGAKMIWESRRMDDGVPLDDHFGVRAMVPLAVATSIDALAVGVSFAFLGVDITPAAISIGVVTFAVSVIGLKIGNGFGARYKARAEFIGGLVLIGMGLKILLDHLDVFG